MTEVGAVVSVEAVAAASPGGREPGCRPVSANRFAGAGRMGWSGVVDVLLWVPSSPQDHWMVPAPNTSAPLAARYSVILWVPVPGATSVPEGDTTCSWVLKVVDD